MTEETAIAVRRSITIERDRFGGIVDRAVEAQLEKAVQRRTAELESKLKAAESESDDTRRALREAAVINAEAREQLVEIKADDDGDPTLAEALAGLEMAEKACKNFQAESYKEWHAKTHFKEKALALQEKLDEVRNQLHEATMGTKGLV